MKLTSLWLNKLIYIKFRFAEHLQLHSTLNLIPFNVAKLQVDRYRERLHWFSFIGFYIWVKCFGFFRSVTQMILTLGHLTQMDSALIASPDFLLLYVNMSMWKWSPYSSLHRTLRTNIEPFYVLQELCCSDCQSLIILTINYVGDLKK